MSLYASDLVQAVRKSAGNKGVHHMITLYHISIYWTIYYTKLTLLCISDVMSAIYLFLIVIISYINLICSIKIYFADDFHVPFYFCLVLVAFSCRINL
jgi:hypothetical protein